MVQDKLMFEDYFYFSTCGHFGQQSITVCTISVEVITKNISVKLFGPEF